MNQAQLVAEVYKVASAYDPDTDDSTSFQDLVQLLELMKTKALKYEILESAFKKPEPELFPVRKTLNKKEALREIEEEREHYRIVRARQAEQRQGQL